VKPYFIALHSCRFNGSLARSLPMDVVFSPDGVAKNRIKIAGTEMPNRPQ
jgi:hypothetical protein